MQVVYSYHYINFLSFVLPPDEPESVTALPDLKLLQLLPYLSDLTVHRHPNAPLPQTVNCYGVVMFADISGIPRRLLI